MRVTDMDIGAYRGDETELLGEIWLHCAPFTEFHIDVGLPSSARGAWTPGPRQKDQISYKIVIPDARGELRIEKRYDLTRIYGRTGNSPETIIPFKLIVPGRQSVSEGRHESSFEVRLRTH